MISQLFHATSQHGQLLVSPSQCFAGSQMNRASAFSGCHRFAPRFRDAEFLLLGYWRGRVLGFDSCSGWAFGLVRVLVLQPLLECLASGGSLCWRSVISGRQMTAYRLLSNSASTRWFATNYEAMLFPCEPRRFGWFGC